MAAPNIVNVVSIVGRSAAVVLSDTATDIVANPAASGKVVRVTGLSVANTAAVAVAMTVSFVDAATAVTAAKVKALPVPVNAAISVLDKPIYLKEGDKITGFGGAALVLQATVTYEEIS